MMEDSALRNELCITIDCCSGVALASTSSSVPALFSYLLSILQDCVQLLQKFSNVPDVVETILELFVNVVKSQIAYLNKVLCKIMNIKEHVCFYNYNLNTQIPLFFN